MKATIQGRVSQTRRSGKGSRTAPGVGCLMLCYAALCVCPGSADAGSCNATGMWPPAVFDSASACHRLSYHGRYARYSYCFTLTRDSASLVVKHGGKNASSRKTISLNESLGASCGIVGSRAIVEQPDGAVLLVVRSSIRDLTPHTDRETTTMCLMTVDKAGR